MIADLNMSGAPEELRPVMDALCASAIELSRCIAGGGDVAASGRLPGVNSDGDEQKPLDIIADEMFMAALRPLSVRHYASEEQEQAVLLNEDGRFALAIDPLDGSSNIDVNVSIGTIFSIYDSKEDISGSFLRPGNEQIAAGYFIYGPQTGLVVSFGAGTAYYLLDPERGKFTLVRERIVIARDSSEFAINASNYRHWGKPVAAFIDDCLAGKDGPHGRNYNMRWVASLVADAHRILSRGGIFLYPADKRSGYGAGRLRLLYECAPIAMLVEQAGGMATDGVRSILSISADELHVRAPFIFGSADNVERIVNYNDLPEHEVSALFGKRGLFRGSGSGS